MLWAAKLTDEDFDPISQFCARKGMTLEQLKDDMELQFEKNFDSYLIVKDPESIQTITFEVWSGRDFEREFKFANEYYHYFRKIERIKS